MCFSDSLAQSWIADVITVFDTALFEPEYSFMQDWARARSSLSLKMRANVIPDNAGAFCVFDEAFTIVKPIYQSNLLDILD